jgi:putative transcriptional regulator
VKNSLRDRRMQAGLTQAELAAALGVSRQTVISIENGRYLPSLPLAFRIARLFEVRLEQLFELTEEDGR